MRILRIIEPSLLPQLTGQFDGVDAGCLPPGLLVAGAMDRTVMRAAERDGEFVACFAAERPRLQVAQMMRIRLLAAANEARPHQGRWCFGKTPMQTFLDAMPMTKEKMIAA